MEKRNAARSLALLWLLLYLFTACGQEAREPDQAVNASDSTLQCLIPADWEDLSGQLNEAASLEVGRPAADSYMVAIPEWKDDFDQGLDLEGYHKIILGHVTQVSQQAEVLETESVELAAGSGILSKVQAEVEGVDIVYWICSLDSHPYYVQILGWTLSGKADKNQQDILSVVQSVSVLPQDEGEDGAGANPEDGTGADSGSNSEDGTEP